MVSKGLLWLITLTAFAQRAPQATPVPSDPLEIVTGEIQTASTPVSREAALQLLARARNNYSLQSAGRGYDLKVSFTVNSGGQTKYDGTWDMEDVSDPQQGLRWTAKTGAGFSTTQISSNNMFYGEGTEKVIPLRLQEARASLLDPIASRASAAKDSIRTATAMFHGTQVTCVLLSGPGSAPAAAPGRSWEEAEECIDPQSGLLQAHSQVPGRYSSYDYSGAPQLGESSLPRKVTITEGGKIVSEISVDSLTELFASDPRLDAALFVPTAEMKAKGPAIAMAGAQKISGVIGKGPFPTGAASHPVCVFGLVTAAGQLVEAHSLQPSDPHSQAAVEAAKRMNFIHPAAFGVRPQQHFVFIIEKFVGEKFVAAK